MNRPRVLILAEQCNPAWPSLPIVGYKYARALAQVCDAVIVTQVRNRPEIEAAGDALDVRYLDTEYVAAPLHRIATWLRGGDEVAWSTSQMMAYLPYLEFERQAWRMFRDELSGGLFDIVHRITPMTPTLPSWIAGRGGVPFVIGPLNGNLDWPAAYRAEQTREREGLRRLRGLAASLPYARRTWAQADAVLAAFGHTRGDLGRVPEERIVSFPEIGFDPGLFHPGDRAAPFSGDGAFEFLFAGRLVPYKVPEVAVRAFCASPRLRRHRLRILGDGPERPRLEAMVAEAGAGQSVVFEGAKTQAEVAEAMRRADAFVFPSIRELGAGVVIEAMACGTLCVVTDYGAPGDLVGAERGIAVPLAPLDDLTESTRAALEGCLDDPADARARAARGQAWAEAAFPWEAKAAHTIGVYDAVLHGRPPSGVRVYD
ncbi:glycosyltransferase [Wenxinia marina]|uniref:Glycosyltransferase n=1 Tax=Wenxinia marina DSM 24838 TaxID=1123501 RepID=A0A0D0PHQ3_9RHOB|nr:glycosyltransferase [Wenxinia marina]KIQ70921.1 Glycosyltransferase [Wenxinia marina DSM 24838]GGL56278.1 hypothetical protein GCM10011392_08410 [Wenxinia marina]